MYEVPSWPKKVFVIAARHKRQTLTTDICLCAEFALASTIYLNMAAILLCLIWYFAGSKRWPDGHRLGVMSEEWLRLDGCSCYNSYRWSPSLSRCVLNARNALNIIKQSRLDSLHTQPPWHFRLFLWELVKHSLCIEICIGICVPEYEVWQYARKRSSQGDIDHQPRSKAYEEVRWSYYTTTPTSEVFEGRQACLLLLLLLSLLSCI